MITPITFQCEQADALQFLRRQETDSVDLIFGSPPYEDARTYGISFRLKGQAWVDWMTSIWLECDRVSKGLVAFVVEGRTHKFRYSATPLLLGAALHSAGLKLRKPPVFHRIGIPGSGGPDFLRNDYEFVLCTSKGKLPWADPTAKANPGNVIRCKVGGGHMGSKTASEVNEAPFPESLAEHFVLPFCPPGGVVLDPFCGSGTTGAVALENHRNFLGCDVRQSQVDATNERLQEITPLSLYEEVFR